MSAWRRSLILLLAAIAAGSCGGPDNAPAVLPQEKEFGAQQHPQLLAEFGGAYRGPEAGYVARVGEKLAGAAGLASQCTFTLVNTDVVNAFAVPGCYIYVTRGLLGIVNSEAELASILGHEIGHIVAAHSRRQQRRSLLTGLGALAVGVLTGSERIAQMAGRAAELFTLRYSRKQEFESDQLGIGYMRTAGYDPFEAADMLDSLARHERFRAQAVGVEDATSIPEWARTHPLTENRISQATEQAKAAGVAPGALAEGAAEYLRQVDGLLYGDDPEQGFVIGRRFSHPVMRITFEAPDGYSLTNSPQAVLIDGRDGTRGQFGGGPLPPAGLEAYAASLLDQLLGGASAPVQVGGLQRANINGLDAVIMPAAVSTREGPVEIVVAAYRAGAGEAFHFITAGPSSQARSAALTELFGSFRLIGAAEVAALRPREIRVVRSADGESLQTLARRMAVPAAPLGHLLMLNDRSADRPLRPGEPIKIISFAGR